MFVLGIDPGLSRCGYGVLQRGAHGPRVHAMGVLRTSPDATVADRLLTVATDVAGLLDEYPVEVVAVERVLFQVNVRSAMSVAQVSGLVMVEARRAGAAVVEYSPNTVKETVAGDGAADKAQVERMVQRTLDITGPIRPVDAADALGVALCHLAHEPFVARVRQATGAAR